MAQIARVARVAMRFSFTAQTFGEFRRAVFALGAKQRSAARNVAPHTAFRLVTLERLMFSRPVDEQLTARNEPLRVLSGAKEGRLWPTT